jgi:DNA-directed RNA polymerase subunit RPC12/RpoP
MSQSQQKLCDACHERLATAHICYGNTGESRDLCDGCFEASAPEELRQSAAAVRTAHCQYCGGQPCTNGSDFLAIAMGIQQTRYMCTLCTQEFSRFPQQELKRAPAGLSQAEQLAAIGALCDKADAHMKQWVSQRGSG